jgi:hypothetical protein
MRRRWAHPPGRRVTRGNTTGTPATYNSNALSDIVTLNYAMLRVTGPTVLPPGPMKELRFELTGNMDRYLWASTTAR